MQKNITLAIPTPCHEKWNSFAKTARGGFCGSCQKEVIDFTGWNEDQLKAYFKKPLGNTCGRFKAEQLKIYTFAEPSTSRVNWLSLTLVSMLLLFSSRQTSAQTITKSKPTTEQIQPEWTVGRIILDHNDSSNVVQGKVSYAGDSSALTGVTVTLRGTMNTTVTDANGNFTLKLERRAFNDTIIFNFIGLKNAVYVVQPRQLKDIKIIMEDETTMLGGYIVGGLVMTRPWYSPSRWWLGVTRCLRK